MQEHLYSLEEGHPVCPDDFPIDELLRGEEDRPILERLLEDEDVPRRRGTITGPQRGLPLHLRITYPDAAPSDDEDASSSGNSIKRAPRREHQAR